MNRFRPFLVIVWCALPCSLALGDDRILFQFDQGNAANAWQTVNDGVMGGRSSGRFRINADQNLEFYGNLSLANNGGFASVRGRNSKMALTQDDVIVARVRGDGRTYRFNLYTSRSMREISFRQSFTTKKGEWVEVELPVKNSVATWRGRNLSNRLDARQVTGLGFLLGDKRPGPFKLEVEWIKVRDPKATTPRTSSTVPSKQ